MYLEFFTPVDEDLLKEFKDSSKYLGSTMEIYTRSNKPHLEGVKIAIFGVLENRLDVRAEQQPFTLSGIRRQLYKLFPGNWDIQLADLGDILPGETVEDTYYAVQETVASLLKANIIPVMLGGSQDLLYPTYRGYTHMDQPVNLVNIDYQFDFADIETPFNNCSYMGNLIMDAPYKLYDYTTIGYQTYFNRQFEIEMMKTLYFDTYRLGEVSADISVVEPVLRDADIVGIDLGALSATTLGNFNLPSPNGFDGKEFCTLARYAGISDRVSAFGIYEYTAAHNNPACNMLIAQALWYFAEGVNYRRNEYWHVAQDSLIKYQVPIEDETLVFYKSSLTGRWWMEIPLDSFLHNNLTRNPLLPCNERDYIDACNQIIPERWYWAQRKRQV